jgi:hypothetical protein
MRTWFILAALTACATQPSTSEQGSKSNDTTPITIEQLVSYFPAGATSVALGRFTAQAQTRASCNDVTGCTSWMPNDPSSIALMPDRENYPLNVALSSAGSTSLTVTDGENVNIVFAFDGGVNVTCQWFPAGYYHAKDGFAGCEAIQPRPGEPVRYSEGWPSAPVYNAGNTIWVSGSVWSDGTFQFVTATGADAGISETSDEPANLNQITITGALQKEESEL